VARTTTTKLKPFDIINRFRHFPVLGLWHEPRNRRRDESEGDKDNCRDGRVDVGESGDGGGQGAADFAHQGGRSNTSSTDGCRHQFTCVHVEDGEAERCREVADQGEHDDGPVARVHATLDEQSAEKHHACDSAANHVGVLATNGLHEHQGQGLRGEVEAGADQEVQEKSTCEILPRQRESVHDEGGGEPVKVHNQSVTPESWVFHNVQKTSLRSSSCRFLQNDLLLLDVPVVPVGGVVEDLPGVFSATSGNQPPG